MVVAKKTALQSTTIAMSAFQCIECENVCNDEEDCAIECFVCKNWAHQHCAALNDEVFGNLCNPLLQKKNLQWVCRPCLEEKKEVQSRHDNRLDKLLDLIPLVHSLGNRLENLEKGLMGEKLEEKIEEVVDRKLSEMIEEKNEIEKRKNNLIMVSIKESTKVDIEARKRDDLHAANTVLRSLVALTEDEVVEPVRLGKMGANGPEC